MKRFLSLIVALLCVAVSTEPASAYLKLGTRIDTRTVTLRWEQFPVRYFVTDAAGGGVSSTQFRDAVNRAFGSWLSVDTASVQADLPA